MASIQRRVNSLGEVKYRVEIRRKGFPQRTATFDSKTKAKEWAIEAEAEMKDRKYFKKLEAEKHTLADVIDRYKRDALPRRKSDIKKVETHLNWWKSRLGRLKLIDLTPAKLAEYRDKLTNEPIDKGKDDSIKKSPATVNRYLASLSIALSHAVEWGWLDENPMSRVKKLSEPRGRVRFLSDDERKALLAQCKDSDSPHLYKVVVLALSTGARFGEIINLTWKEVDIKHRVIRLEKTKNGERRSIPLTGHAYELLEAMNKVRKINTKYVFPSKDGQKPADIRDGWELAVKRAGLEDFRFHDLRHTAASYLAMNGATLAEISDILGHKTLSMVKRYTHLTKQHTAGVLERMNKVQFSD